MKKFFAEFKKFITRGNVLDMSVGVIVGGAFTAIVNGMTNNILKPVVNWLIALVFGQNSMSGIYTYLTTAYKDVVNEAGEVVGQEIDLANSIYMDWGALISAILNFFITALVLFIIVRIINKMREDQSELKSKKLSCEQRAELRANGVKIRDKKAVEAYFAEKQRLADEAAAAKAAADAEAARLEREANPTTEDLLKMILSELKNK